jgi:hypothetical protein
MSSFVFIDSRVADIERLIFSGTPCTSDEGVFGILHGTSRARGEGR